MALDRLKRGAFSGGRKLSVREPDAESLEGVINTLIDALNAGGIPITGDPGEYVRISALGDLEGRSLAEMWLDMALDAALLLKANRTDVLELTNTTVYTPTQNYHPATKLYADTVAAGGGYWNRTGTEIQPANAGDDLNLGAGNILVAGTVDGRDVSIDGAKLDAIEAGADVTDTANVDAAGAVMNTDFNATTILKADSDNTPIPLAIGTNEVVGRAGGGAIDGLTAAQLRTLINVDEGADVTADNPPQAHAATHQSAGADSIRLDDLAAPQDNTDLNATNAAHGLLPKLSNVSTEYLDGQGNFSTPVGGGTVDISGTPVAQDFARFTDSNTIEGRSYTEVRSDLNVEDGADVTDAANVDAAGAVMEGDYNANTVLSANTDNTPTPLTVAEQRLLGRITGGNIAALTAAQIRTLLNVEDGADATDAASVDAAGAVMEVDFEANSVLAANVDNTPLPLPMVNSTFLGRPASGNIAALTLAQARTLLNVEDGAEANNISDLNATDLTDGGDTSLHTHDARYFTEIEIGNKTAGSEGALLVGTDPKSSLGAADTVEAALTATDSHVGASSGVHGITGDVVGTTDTQNLTNKSLVTPTIGDLTNMQHDHTGPASGGVIWPDESNVLYVGKHGSDSDSGATIQQAFLTFKAAINWLRGSLVLVSASGLTVGDTVTGDTSGAVATVKEISGTTIYLDGRTLDFQVETLNGAAYSATAVNGMVGPLSAAKNYSLECFDAGVYTENISVPSYVKIQAPSANLTGTASGTNIAVEIDEYASVVFDQIFAPAAGVTAVSKIGAANSRVEATLIQCMSTANGVTASGGTLAVYIRAMAIVNGTGITGSAASNIIGILGKAVISGSGTMLDADNDCVIELTVAGIEDTGATGTGVSVAAGNTATLTIGQLQFSGGGTPIDIATTGVLNIVPGDIDGTISNYGAMQIAGGVFTSGAISEISSAAHLVDGVYYYAYDIKTLLQWDGTAWSPMISYGDVDVYVDDALGTDASGYGYSSGAGAFATIQYAIDSVPPINGGNIAVNVAGGVRSQGTTISFSITGSTVTLTDTAALFTAAMTGKTIQVKGATTPANDGAFAMTYISPTQVSYTNASGATEAGVAATTIYAGGIYNENITIQGKGFSATAELSIVGTPLAADSGTAGTGSAKGNGNPAIGWGQVVDTTKTWTVNEHRGRLCETASAGTGLIVSNTATTLVIAATFTADPTGGAYSILDTETTKIACLTANVLIKGGQKSVFFDHLCIDGNVHGVSRSVRLESFSEVKFYYCSILNPSRGVNCAYSYCDIRYTYIEAKSGYNGFASLMCRFYNGLMVNTVPATSTSYGMQVNNSYGSLSASMYVGYNLGQDGQKNGLIESVMNSFDGCQTAVNTLNAVLEITAPNQYVACTTEVREIVSKQGSTIETEAQTDTSSTYSMNLKNYSGNSMLRVEDDGGIHSPQMKSGISQVAAGAVLGELWFDTSDGNTIKMGV